MPDPFARAALSVFTRLGSDETYTPPGGAGQAVRVVYERDSTTQLQGLDVMVIEPQTRVHFQRSGVPAPAVGGTITDAKLGKTWRVDGIVREDECVVVTSVREAV